MRKLGVIFLFVLAIGGIVSLGIYFFWNDLTEAQAILLTGFIGSLLALWGLFSQRSITRRQVTLEHISRLEADGDLIRARQKFRELAKDPEGLAKWAAADKEESSEAQTIFTVLNEFELISIGIQRGIIDFEIFSRWFKAGTVNKWNAAAPFVTTLRNRTRPTLYHEFESMVGWFNDDRMPHRNWWMGWIF